MGAEQMRKRSLGCRASSLFVEEILAADLVEGGESAGPACDDLFRSHACLQLLDRVRVADEREKFRRIELFRIEPLQNCGDFEAHAHCAHAGAIDDSNRDTAATLAAIRTGNSVEELGEFSNGQAVTNRQRKICDEIGLVGI